jgi:hypothetical protein
MSTGRRCTRGVCSTQDRLFLLSSAANRAIHRPTREHTELEEELHEIAHIDYDRVAIVRVGNEQVDMPR